MSNNLKKYSHLIKHHKDLPVEIQKLLYSKNIPDSWLKVLCEICKNILKKNISLKSKQIHQLSKYKSAVKLLSNHSTGKKRKRKTLQLVGHGIIPILLGIIAPILSSIISKFVGGRAKR